MMPTVTPKTQWQTQYYDPLAEPRAPFTYCSDPHHLIFAAMLDGVRGRREIEKYTGIHYSTVNKCQRDLARHGYIRLGNSSGRPCYLLLDDEDTFRPAVTPEQVERMFVLRDTRGYTQNDIAHHMKINKWVVADAMQGRRGYAHLRVAA